MCAEFGASYHREGGFAGRRRAHLAICGQTETQAFSRDFRSGELACGRLEHTLRQLCRLVAVMMSQPRPTWLSKLMVMTLQDALAAIKRRRVRKLWARRHAVRKGAWRGLCRWMSACADCRSFAFWLAACVPSACCSQAGSRRARRLPHLPAFPQHFVAARLAAARPRRRQTHQGVASASPSQIMTARSV